MPMTWPVMWRPACDARNTARSPTSVGSIQQRSENIDGDAGEAAFRLTPTAFVLGFPDEVGGIKTGTYSLDDAITVVGRVAQRRSLSRHLLFVDLIDGVGATTRAQIILQQQQQEAAGDMKEIKVGVLRIWRLRAMNDEDEDDDKQEL